MKAIQLLEPKLLRVSFEKPDLLIPVLLYFAFGSTAVNDYIPELPQIRKTRPPGIVFHWN